MDKIDVTIIGPTAMRYGSDFYDPDRRHVQINIDVRDDAHIVIDVSTARSSHHWREPWLQLGHRTIGQHSSLSELVAMTSTMRRLAAYINALPVQPRDGADMLAAVLAHYRIKRIDVITVFADHTSLATSYEHNKTAGFAVATAREALDTLIPA